MLSHSSATLGTTTQFFGLLGGAIITSTESEAECYAPIAGTITAMTVRIATQTGVGNTRIFTLRLNGTTDTALTCTTINGAGTRVCSATGSIAIVKGDRIVLKAAVTGTPVASTLQASILFDGVPRNETWLCGQTGPSTQINGPDITSLNGSNANGTWCGSVFDSECVTLAPIPGRIRRLMVTAGTAPGSGNSYVYTVYKQTVATALTCTISGTATTCENFTDDITVASGDSLVLKVALTGTANPHTFTTSTTFRSDIEGLFIYPYSPDAVDLNNAAGNSKPPNGHGGPISAGAGFGSIARAIDAKYVAAKVKVAPGGVSAWSFYLSAGSGSLSCTIAGATETTCTGQATSLLSFAAGSALFTSVTPNTLPAVTRSTQSYAARVAPSRNPILKVEEDQGP